ncbi:hypothetical protein FRACYDRAFT_267519 [Fragilariopsis cylindrus CCMP1102]|uniref:Uncharacterized protein n=1 Tax=Fragilariopsis cylindrus CCMP1102 TaxID=635003 RepID=A0A1E7FZ26_9STRA|nr:hypothetical protein FRACYDRAFT_267519 [Fragilariopsis cylindrus CCMP1102]|eukprot:OEU23412.1 hypothetical protein FRACYDRAFT_267519 [Fragilariopsis cylindrus CCMP1102]
MVVQPKFSWSPVVQPNLSSSNNNATTNRTNNNRQRRELLLSGSAPPQVELLSIIRVNIPTQLDRKMYPYARLDRVCCITTNDTNYPSIVLECPSEGERDWLVFILKLMVARLASIIITRDEEMLHEFFSPYSALMQLEEDDIDNHDHSTGGGGGGACPDDHHCYEEEVDVVTEDVYE